MGEKERRCLITGERKNASEMIRFVRAPDGTLVPDIEARLPGRGMWVSAHRRAVETAVAKKRFEAEARRHGMGPLSVPGDLADRVASALRTRILSLLGLARRTGDIVAGFEAIERAAQKGADIVCLIEAADGAADGKRKLRRRLPGTPAAEMFTRQELSQTLGRENVTHLGLKRSRLADKIRLEMTRLGGVQADADARESHSEAQDA